MLPVILLEVGLVRTVLYVLPEENGSHELLNLGHLLFSEGLEILAGVLNRLLPALLSQSLSELHFQQVEQQTALDA